MDERGGRGVWRGRAAARRRRLVGALAAVATALLCAPVAVAAPGDLDSTFSGDGLLATDFGFGGSDLAADVVVQGDGKTVAVGESDGSLGLARYNADGSLDASFAGDGKQRTRFSDDGYDGSAASGVAMDDGGKIVVAGSNGDGAFAVARYNGDGSPDTTFSGDGKQTTEFDDSYSAAAAAVLVQDGAIVVVGSAYDQNYYPRIAVARYTANGSLDSTFSGDGRQTIDVGPTFEAYNESEAAAVALQPDGKIVIAGSHRHEPWSGGSVQDLLVVRLNADGSSDASFSGDGHHTTDFGGDESAAGIAVQGDGRIVVAGDSAGDVVLARYNADGSLDPNFSGDGKQVTDFGATGDSATDIALQPDGRLVVGGAAFDENTFYGGEVAVARYLIDGSPDMSFGESGQRIIEFGSLSNVGGVGLQADGKIVMAGTTRLDFFAASEDDFALVRFTQSGQLDASFSGDGKQMTDFSGSDEAADVAVQPDGKIVAVGSSGSGDFAITRYNPDGSLDASFSGDGKQTIEFVLDSDVYHAGTATAVAIQPDGKIVLVGYVANYCCLYNDAAIARLNEDGTLDTTFSGDGRQVTDLGSNLDFAIDVAVQTDGRIVVVGKGDGPTVVRYSADGSLDPSFGDDGQQTEDGFLGYYGVALQPDGKILAAGSSSGRFELTRFNSDGSLDPTFAGGGKQTTDFPGFVQRVALGDDGKAVVVGSGGGGFAVARFRTDGSLDPTFSDDGKQTTDFGSGGDGARDVVVQPDGKVVAAGSVTNASGRSALGLVRYNVNGSPDTSFSGDGRQTTEAGIGTGANGVALQGDGQIVTAGGVRRDGDTGFDFVLARYEGGGGSADTTPPETTITTGPAGTTADSTPTFGFSSNEAGSSFECRVDGAAFAPCSSPHTTAALTNGSHTFEARATDQSDNVDPTPASRAFTVAVPPPPPPPPDSDGDGVPDGSDGCPSVAASTATGCPSSAGGTGQGGSPAPGGSGGTPGGETGDEDSEGDTPSVDAPAVAGSKSAGRAKVSPKGRLTVPRQSLDCTGTGPDCAVTTALNGSVPANRARASAKRRKRETVRLGRSRFKVEAGEKGRITVKLTRKGLKLLRRHKRIKAKVTITVRRGGETAKKTVTLTLKAPKAKRRQARR